MDYRLVTAADLPAAHQLEVASFPADEAASLEGMQMRQSQAPQLFLGSWDPSTSQLVAFANATLSSSRTLTHEAMEQHDPTGSYVNIHSVVVAASHRRKGIAQALLHEYFVRIKQQEGVKGVVLISKQNLVPMYQKAGFVLRGPSEVVHGQDPWFELGIDFDGAQEAISEKQAVAVEEEEEDEGDIRNPGKKLSSSKVGGIEGVVDKETGLNSADLFCPRAECRCLLLRKGAGKWVRGHKSDFELTSFPFRSQLPALPHLVGSAPSPSTSHGYWSIPSPLTFENIGFSRNAAPPQPSSSGSLVPSSAPTPTPAAATIKYLICADCDHGPLGWHDTEGRDLGVEVADENEGVGSVRKGREFLLDVERVRYRL
ncbi:Mss4-like protein [Leucosporidium creatinivorum]|uniref:Mss4-like protein n=1 Tax=Leucosporidium creatinivorum TaxID=106004 RepID=A0A1Y2G008_9BASI|nr:Mss4-like protein [Leucosporidium creatinivorum]